MSENRFHVRVWVDAGEVRFVNSNELPIKHEMVQIEGAQVYDFSVLGDYMLAGTVMEQLSVVDGALNCGSLNVDAMKRI